MGYLQAIFEEEEFDNKVLVRNNRTTTTDGKINELFGITEQFKFILEADIKRLK